MRKIKSHQIATLLGLFALAACEDSATDTVGDLLTAAEAAELQVLEDDGALEVALELQAETNDVAEAFGLPLVAEGRALNAQAERHFAAARVALGAGDRRRALQEARDARMLLARAIFATGGEEAVEALIERVEDLAAELGSEDDDVFDDPEGLKAKIIALADEARAQFEAGEFVRAAERALLAEQIIWRHRGRRHFPGEVVPERARLAVALAGTAVQLAERLIAADSTPVRSLGASDARHHMNRWLAHAKRMLAKAELALANGHYARAVHFAEHAHWAALKAVILPGGVTKEEIDALVALAEHLYEEAEAAIGDEPTELEAQLLARAGRLIELGKTMLENGNKRGVAPIWRAAVISRWLMD
jgi:HEPN domain-containing protein